MIRAKFSIKWMLIATSVVTISIWGYYAYLDFRARVVADEYLEVLDSGRDFMHLQMAIDRMDDRAYSMVENELKSRYSFRSLEGRVRGTPIRLNESETNVQEKAMAKKYPWENKDLDYFYSFRLRALEELHSESVEAFIKREGFGIYRIPRESVYDLSPGVPPKHRSLSSQTRSFPADFGTEVKQVNALGMDIGNVSPLHNKHLINYFDFANKGKSGVINEEGEVAGFIPHYISAFDSEDSAYKMSGMFISGGVELKDQQPFFVEKKDQTGWRIDRFELVSLLEHEEPRVYLSENLPNMEDLSEHRTRDLDGFEKAALKRLQNNEQIVVRQKGDKTIMLGAVRARTDCRQCHDVKYGDLLGAFSYELTRVDGEKEK